MLNIQHIIVGYGQRTVLEDFSLELTIGKMIGILGPNGAGKSTLIKSILGLVPLRQGEILFNQQAITRNLRQNAFAYVPQSSDLDITAPLTLYDLVAMGRMVKKRPWDSMTVADKQAIERALTTLNIEPLRDRPVSDLSGGQRQRALVARALVQDAQVYFLDEPFVGIDATSEAVIVSVLRQLRDAGKLILIVHHDLSNVAAYFDEIVLINHEVVAQGTPSDVLNETTLYKTYGDHVVMFAPGKAADDE